MQLHKAIDRVLKLAAKGKGSPTLYQSVRMVPVGLGGVSRVYATDGLVSVEIPVDLDVPDVLLPADVMRKICKHEIYSVTNTDGEVSIRLKSGGYYTVTALDPRGYPFPTEVPTGFVDLDYWPHILPALHSAGGPKAKAGLRGVRFGPDWVGATDSVRVSVVSVPGWSDPVLVPSGVFKAIPKGVASLSITSSHGFLKIWEEIRSGALIPMGGYPDLAGYVGDGYVGEALVLPTRMLRECVQRATQISPTKTVVLEMRYPEIELKAWSVTEEGQGYSARIAGRGVSSDVEPVVMVVNGKLLVETLKGITTPKVRLCYDASHSPIRIEAGAMVEVLQPWRV